MRADLDPTASTSSPALVHLRFEFDPIKLRGPNT
jgi:hypothetical protein